MNSANWKVGREALRRERARRRRRRVKLVKSAAKDVRERDRVCRFPKCGCATLGFSLKAISEVSHELHRGMGGNPTGDRSTTAGMCLLCKWRHQDARFSLHKRSLRVRFLTDRGFDGPIAWEIDCGRMPGARGTRLVVWRVLAIESEIGVWLPFDDWQLEVLEELAAMEL